MWDLQTVEFTGLSESSVINVGQNSYRVPRLHSLIKQGIQNCWAPLKDYLNKQHANSLLPGSAPRPISCEVLAPGSPDWQKGQLRMKVVIEFIPDEPEQSPPIEQATPKGGDNLFDSLTRQA